MSATKKSSGKTVVSLGLGAALKLSGHHVQAFKKGPDYIDPMWQAAATGRPCYNLDFFTQTQTEIQHTFDAHRSDADIVYIEGNKGLFDGVDTQGSDCNAALANQLDLPVVLVVNAQGVTRGIAPLLMGYEQFAQNTDQKIRYAGIILNEVAGARHQSKLLAAIAEYTDLTVLGCVPKLSKLRLEERHLGLVPENEASHAKNYIQQAAEIIQQNVDIKQLLERSAKLSAPLQTRSVAKTRIRLAAHKVRIKIGIAKDSAFGFYYPDDLQAMQDLGAELIYFDTLKDKNLPTVDALFIGGGFPETQMDALEANHAMRRQIKKFIDSGAPVYAECGGLMYLCNSIHYQNKTAKMVGAIDADIKMTSRPIGRGYAIIKANKSHLWGTQMESLGALNCHEFHYSKLEKGEHESHISSETGAEMGSEMAYDTHRGYGVDGQQDGLMVKQTLANYCHQRHTQNNPWVKHFIDFIKRTKATV